MSHEQARSHPDIHQLGEAGRFWCWFDNREDGDAVFLTSPLHRFWRFHLSDHSGSEIDTLRELLEAFDFATSSAELQFLLDCIQSVETWQETCPDDLARFGEVGVSF